MLNPYTHINRVLVTMSTVKHTASFEIAQPVDELFPLFSAEGEKLWVPGWDYENIMGSTDIQEDYVFLTKNHDHASGPHFLQE